MFISLESVSKHNMERDWSVDPEKSSNEQNLAVKD